MQENHYPNEKRWSSEANTEMNQMLELSDKDLKAAGIKNAPTINHKLSGNTWKNRKFQQRKKL